MSLAAPVTFAIVAGALPPGLTLDAGGFLSGIPNTPGQFAFTIRASGADGNSVARSYTMAVGEITPAFLPDANTSDPYAEALTADGFSGTVEWSIIAGSLPVPLELNPSTGVISGDAPEDSGDFFFTVQATDGVLTCSKDYDLHVEGAQVQVYWPLEGPPLANTDSVSGQVLFVNNFGATLSSPPAKVGNGFQITGGFCNLSQSTQNLLYGGTGFTVALWMNWTATGAVEGFQYSFCSAPIQNLVWTVNNTGSGAFIFTYDGASNISGPTVEPSPGAWHLVVFKYDPADGNLSMSVDGAAFVVLGNVGVITVNPEPSPYMLCGNEEIIWDEVGVFSFPFDAADLAYIWNGGAGRTWPLSFPP